MKYIALIQILQLWADVAGLSLRIYKYNEKLITYTFHTSRIPLPENFRICREKIFSPNTMRQINTI